MVWLIHSSQLSFYIFISNICKVIVKHCREGLTCTVTSPLSSLTLSLTSTLSSLLSYWVWAWLGTRKSSLIRACTGRASSHWSPHVSGIWSTWDHTAASHWQPAVLSWQPVEFFFFFIFFFLYFFDVRVEIIKPQLTGVYHPHKGKLKDRKKKKSWCIKKSFCWGSVLWLFPASLTAWLWTLTPCFERLKSSYE